LVVGPLGVARLVVRGILGVVRRPVVLFDVDLAALVLGNVGGVVGLGVVLARLLGRRLGGGTGRRVQVGGHGRQADQRNAERQRD
jgi:hypothetical protein